MSLRHHTLKLVLVEPKIAPNVGNIARLCVATATERKDTFGFLVKITV